jgi:hypothetical protein
MGKGAAPLAKEEVAAATAADVSCRSSSRVSAPAVLPLDGRRHLAQRRQDDPHEEQESADETRALSEPHHASPAVEPSLHASLTAYRGIPARTWPGVTASQ